MPTKDINTENKYLKDARNDFNKLVLKYQKSDRSDIRAQIEGVFEGMKDIVREVESR